MAPLRTALKPDPVDELEKVALTGIEELDTDLFDNVSYLDLMTKKIDRDSRRKQEHLDNLRRLRERYVCFAADVFCSALHNEGHTLNLIFDCATQYWIAKCWFGV